MVAARKRPRQLAQRSLVAGASALLGLVQVAAREKAQVAAREKAQVAAREKVQVARARRC